MMNRPLYLLLFAALFSSQTRAEDISGITFGGRSGTLYVPVRSIGEALGMSVGFASGRATLNGEEVPDAEALPDGIRVVPLRALTPFGVTVRWDAEAGEAVVSRQDAEVRVARGHKRVVIDKSRQLLQAWQGDLLVIRTPVSTGRQGRRTPNGSFTAGPYKARMHYSSLYNRAPMPYSVQIVGDIFVHGYASVPEVPASHGCIRVPLDGSARAFFEWVDVGTPVTIEGRWGEATEKAG
jgi:hypothetical protein